MYRDYEDPRALEKRLQTYKRMRENILKALHKPNHGHTYYDGLQEELISCEETISELEQRVNFAWQDEEFG